MADPRKDTVSREVLRHPEFAGCVELGRVRDHFICAFFCILTPQKLTFLVCTVNVESEGPYVPERLLPEAISVLRTKIATLRQAAELLLNGGEASDAEMDVS